MDVKKININQSEQTYNIASDIYDVTAHNNDATFESLSALLSSDNLSTLIPTAVRCGGMIIRFVQSSDNKYVQYRLMDTSFSTDEDDWRGTDELTNRGGNMILDWNTDIATTRKQVLSKYRKPGVQISYKDPNNSWINEQYIGTAITDLEWVKDSNWSKLPNSNDINNKLSYNQQINLDLILTLDNLQKGLALSSDGNSVVINSGASLSPIIKVNTGDVIKLSSTFVSYSYKDGVVVSKLSTGTIIVDDTFNEVRFSVATAIYNTPITILRNRAIGEVSAIRSMMPYINVEEDITNNNKKKVFG